MSQKEIRPAANGTDTKSFTTSIPSQHWKLCSQHGGTAVSAVTRSACQICQSEYKHHWYETNKPRVRIQQRQYCIANIGRVWAKSHRKRKRKYGLPLITDLITREELIRRYGDSCVYCKTGPFEQIDHIIPVRAGGHHQLGNVVPSCAPCNMKKRWGSDRIWIQWFDDDRARDAGNGPSDAVSRT